MGETGIEKKLESLQSNPKISGHIVSEADDSLLLHAGSCIAEIPRRYITSQRTDGNDTELVLKRDAEILISTTVSVQKGFVADDIFGALVPDVLANNCNCNCNCDANCNCNCNCECTECCECTGGSSVLSVIRTSTTFRKPFTGGAR